MLSGDRLNILSAQRLDGNRLTVRSHELDFIGCTVGMDENDGPDISGDQAVRGQIHA